MTQPASSQILKPFDLGGISIDPPLLLAPMAAHTHAGFRSLVRELGCCGLVCSELISSHVLSHNPQSKKTREHFDWSSKEWPFAVQLFGSCPKEMAKAAQIVVDEGAPIVDINMGCWVPKVAKKGYGAALLDDLPRAEAVVGAVCRAVEVPVTVKVRVGFVEGQPTAFEFARAARDLGACLVSVHGRYAKQGFGGISDHGVTRKIKDAMGDSLRVVANGDIIDTESAREVIEETGCDGLMIGREALRRPWLFAELASEFSQKETAVTEVQPWEIARRHVELTRELVDKPEKVLVRELRGQLLPYRLGCPPSHRGEERLALEMELRQVLVKVSTFRDIDDFLELARDKLGL